MAGIDKIYGTTQQRDELLEWLSKNEVEISCRVGYDGTEDILENVKPSEYVRTGDWEDEGVISNFPTDIDLWLWKYCPIQFVRERLNEQHHYIDIIDKLNNTKNIDSEFVDIVNNNFKDLI